MQFGKFILPFFGFIFLGLGGIGVFLPVWPTTPFVLLSIACFSSTPRIKAWLMRNTFFRSYIENYEKRNGLPLKTFVISMIWLWGMLIISIFVVDSWMIRIALLVIGIFVSIHLIVILKPKKKDDDE